VIRVAAVGDVHIGEGMRGCYADDLAALAGRADVLLLAGDLTRRGTVAEAGVVADEFAASPVPVVAVLGNHDLQSDDGAGVTAALVDRGITVLEGTSTVLEVGGVRLGVAGTVGFGGGFHDAAVVGFGDPETKAFAARGRALATGLGAALRELECDLAVALTHYAPITETLVGEPRELYPFLGSHLLGDAIDSCRPALALHGHAHSGSPDGRTPGGVPVHNVARPVLGRPYRVFPLEP
jgi:Icc-related predicted phosphoesterase